MKCDHAGILMLRTALTILLLILAFSHIDESVARAKTEAVILKPIENGYVDSLQPKVNFAGSNLVVEYFYVRPQNRQRWALLLFDLSTIPSSIIIESAQAHLYASEVHGDLKVGAFMGSYTTWSGKDLYWTFVKDTVLEKTANNTQQITGVGWYNFDVKSHVQDSLATGKLTIVLKPDYGYEFEHAAQVTFYSNDQPLRFNTPRLEVVYSTAPTKPSKQTTDMELSVEPDRVQYGARIMVSGVLKVDGTPLKDQPISIEYYLDGAGWNTITTVETNRSGAFTFNWKPERAGDIKIRASYAGAASYSEAEHIVELQVTPVPTPTPRDESGNLVAVAIVVIVVATALIVIMARQKRRRARAIPEGFIGHVPIGHKGLDQLLCGGLRTDYVVAVTSPSCDEVDLLTHRFLKTVLEAGNSILYITTKMDEGTEFSQKYPFGFYNVVCNPQMGAEKPGGLDTYTVEGLDSLTELNLTISKAFEVMEARALMEEAVRQKVVCIDLISDVLLQHRSSETRLWLLDFISKMKSRSVTTLAILNSQIHSKEELGSILSLFDGQIDIWEEKTTSSVQKFIQVKRMYRAEYLDKPLALRRTDLS